MTARERPQPRYVYRDAAGQLEARLARVAKYRQNMIAELCGIEKFLCAHPELTEQVTGGWRPRLVVDNERRYRPCSPDDGPSAA
jgi:hypothetical protein